MGTQEEAVKRMEQTRPTPTQEENDKAAMGEPVNEHAPDGSPEQDAGAVTQTDQEKRKADRAKSVETAVQRMEKTVPTPTQEENDKTASGEVLETHAPDGSPEQEAGAVEKKDKDAQAKPAGATYQTRAARARKTEETPATPAT